MRCDKRLRQIFLKILKWGVAARPLAVRQNNLALSLEERGRGEVVLTPHQSLTGQLPLRGEAKG